jgi:hypothetical protein
MSRRRRDDVDRPSGVHDLGDRLLTAERADEDVRVLAVRFGDRVLEAELVGQALVGGYVLTETRRWHKDALSGST